MRRNPHRESIRRDLERRETISRGYDKRWLFYEHPELDERLLEFLPLPEGLGPDVDMPLLRIRNHRHGYAPELYRALIELSQDGVVRMDIEGRDRTCNECGHRDADDETPCPGDPRWTDSKCNKTGEPRLPDRFMSWYISPQTSRAQLNALMPPNSELAWLLADFYNIWEPLVRDGELDPFDVRFATGYSDAWNAVQDYLDRTLPNTENLAFVLPDEGNAIAPLYTNGHADTYIEMSETGVIRTALQRPGDLVTEDVQRNRTLRWEIPENVAWAALLEWFTPASAFAGDMSRVYAGHSVSEDGYGELTPDANHVRTEIQNYFNNLDDVNPGALIWVQDAVEWLEELGFDTDTGWRTDEYIIDYVIRADTTDAELEEMAEAFTEIAEEGNTIIEGLPNALFDIREEYRERRGRS
jgi:hypothetical protein